MQHSVTILLTVQPENYNLMIVATPSEGGTTTPAPGNRSVSSGSSVTIYEKPSNGWTFDHWVVNGVIGANTSAIDFTVSSSETIVAVFSPVVQSQTSPTVYPVTIGSSGASSPGVIVDGIAYQTPVTFLWTSGSTHNVTAKSLIPITGTSEATFQSWSGTINSTKGMLAVVVGGPMTLTESYLTRYSVKITLDDHLGAIVQAEGVELVGQIGQITAPVSGQLWLPNGTYHLISADWKGVNLIQTGAYPVLMVAGATTTIVSVPVYDVTVHVQDIFGNPLAGAQVSMSFPDGSVITNTTGVAGMIEFSQVPSGGVQLSIEYLGVSNSFALDASQNSSPSVTVALSYPVFALVGLGAGTIAIAALRARHRRAAH